jgi:hypothetical protein
MRHPQTKSEQRYNTEWQRLFNRLPLESQRNIVCAPIGRTACELSGEVLRNMERQKRFEAR